MKILNFIDSETKETANILIVCNATYAHEY